ncbi:hypothetical protein Egran_05079 [Elaphomyces granulatus]|uniref:G-protein coupled receptors family 2 profile 2 domain-containing protein n=1 Tax=Elaphomyces granulatus TaxID=519963 RepID=A0A232LSN5_9EURO|nr:hypothetical protein Egran_05079 [Elaphomyces granulatus]
MATNLNGNCPFPFMQEDLFATRGGYIGGRFCANKGNTSCCFPCPLTDWRYEDALKEKTSAASWLSVGLFPLSIFLLLSYLVLSEKWTHRHYINICLTLSMCCIQIAFIIPLGTRPDQCYNEITPNDMTSSLSCAFTGSLLLFGGLAVTTWSTFTFGIRVHNFHVDHSPLGLCRTIALHLQVCWEVTIGPKFMWTALLCGWGIPSISLAFLQKFTGVSFRFGEVCHINSIHSLQDYWIPVAVIASAALVLQFITLGYCIHVYIKSLCDDNPTTTTTSGLPSVSGSLHAPTPRRAYKRARRAIRLQWRSITLVLTLLTHVVFFAVIFIRMNAALVNSPENLAKATPWIDCLVLHQGNKQACLSATQDLGPNEASLIATLLLLPLTGVWSFVFIIRSSMLMGWVDLFKRIFVHRDEFVSADARPEFPDVRTYYEMLDASRQNAGKCPDPLVTAGRSPTPTPASPSTLQSLDGKGADTVNCFGGDAKYLSPKLSFSSPRPPSSTPLSNNRQWDHTTSFAR